jgi:hypothetical protein
LTKTELDRKTFEEKRKNQYAKNGVEALLIEIAKEAKNLKNPNHLGRKALGALKYEIATVRQVRAARQTGINLHDPHRRI